MIGTFRIMAVNKAKYRLILYKYRLVLYKYRLIRLYILY